MPEPAACAPKRRGAPYLLLILLLIGFHALGVTGTLASWLERNSPNAYANLDAGMDVVRSRTLAFGSDVSSTTAHAVDTVRAQALALAHAVSSSGAYVSTRAHTLSALTLNALTQASVALAFDGALSRYIYTLYIYTTSTAARIIEGMRARTLALVGGISSASAEMMRAAFDASYASRERTVAIVSAIPSAAAGAFDATFEAIHGRALATVDRVKTIPSTAAGAWEGARTRLVSFARRLPRTPAEATDGIQAGLVASVGGISSAISSAISGASTCGASISDAISSRSAEALQKIQTLSGWGAKDMSLRERLRKRISSSNFASNFAHSLGAIPSSYLAGKPEEMGTPLSRGAVASIGGAARLSKAIAELPLSFSSAESSPVYSPVHEHNAHEAFFYRLSEAFVEMMPESIPLPSWLRPSATQTPLLRAPSKSSSTINAPSTIRFWTAARSRPAQWKVMDWALFTPPGTPAPAAAALTPRASRGLLAARSLLAFATLFLSVAWLVYSDSSAAYRFSSTVEKLRRRAVVGVASARTKAQVLSTRIGALVRHAINSAHSNSITSHVRQVPAETKTPTRRSRRSPAARTV